VSTDFDSRPDSRKLADLKNQTEELERKLSDARMSLERELAQSAWGSQPAPGYSGQNGLWALEEMTVEPGGSAVWVPYAEPEPYPEPELYSEPGPPADYGDADPYDWAADEDRTEVLVSRGRRSARARRLPRGYKVGIAAAVGIVLVTVTIGMLFHGSPSWPPSVARVQAEAARACRNPDVQSEPGQVNFACAQGTRQILWVFALLTSGSNPDFADAKTGRRGLALLKWGLVPRESLGGERGFINARAETAWEKPSFAEAFASRRCLIPATGFYEWQKIDPKRRQPWLFRLASGHVFAFAGLWEPAAQVPGAVPTCTILTTEPNEVASPVHDRMPAILDPADYGRWLDTSTTVPADVRPLLKPFPSSAMTAFPVTTAVNNPAFDDPACLAPA